MRYEMNEIANGKVQVIDTKTGLTAYGRIENGYGRANTSSELAMITRAIRERK